MTHPDTLTIPRAVVEQALGRAEFEQWYACNAFNFERDPIGSRDCGLQWVAWQASRAALQPQDAVTTSGPPERDNSKPAEQQGVFRKFNVQRADGSDQPGGKHHGCEYFVLDVANDQHAKPALEAYAVACATTHPKLSADMRERYGLQPQADTSVLQAAPWPPQAAAEPSIPAGFALVPIQTTRAMEEVFAEEGWEWANLLAAAEAVTLEQYEYALSTTPPATQAALTAALDYLWVVVEHNRLHFGDSHNTVIQGQAVVAQLEALGVKHG